jgi:hypothetical protein
LDKSLATDCDKGERKQSAKEVLGVFMNTKWSYGWHRSSPYVGWIVTADYY